MDSQITIQLDEKTLKIATKLAAYKGMNLSEFTKILIQEAAEKEEKFLQQFPVADWVLQLGEGPVQFDNRSWKEKKAEYYESKK